MKKKILSAFLAGSMLVGGGAIAADNMDAFKEAYLATPVDNRAFHEAVEFFGPEFHGELNGTSFILRDATMKMSGTISWQFTDPNTYNTTEESNIPFYVEQNGDVMTMYVQRSGSWSKFNLPAVPVALANAIKTTDVNILQQNMSAVKSVDIVSENADQRVMQVNLDGKKLAELLHTYNDDRIANLSQAERTEQKTFIDHLADGLQTTDVTCSWTVDKKTWRTVSATVNLTDVMRAYAKDILDDAAKGEIVLSQSDRSFYESLGYFSELHTRAAYYVAGDGSQPQMPQGASSARNNPNVFQDLSRLVGSEARK